jgi:general stress protein 26
MTGRNAFRTPNAIRKWRSVRDGRRSFYAVYIAVDGSAELIRDKAAFAQPWTADLDEWFERGIDTPGLVLLKVQATRIKAWERNEEH